MASGELQSRKLGSDRVGRGGLLLDDGRAWPSEAAFRLPEDGEPSPSVQPTKRGREHEGRVPSWLASCFCCGQARLERLGRRLPVRVGSLQVALSWLALVVLLAQRLSLSVSSFPIFDLQYRWTRMDQAVFLGGAFLGGMWTPLLGTLVARELQSPRAAMGASLTIIAVMNWLFRYSWSSFYEMWVNRALTATIEGFAEGMLITTVWRWIPAKDLAAAVVILWSSVGCAMALAETTAVHVFGGTGNFSALFALQSLGCLVVGCLWVSPLVAFPGSNSLVGAEERQRVMATAGFGASSSIRWRNWLQMASAAASSFELWLIWLAAVAYGWLLGPYLSFNAAYFMELVSLRMVIAHLPPQSRYPWLLWVFASAAMAGLLMALSKQGATVKKLRQFLTVSEGVSLLITVLALRSIGDYHSIGTTLSKYCSMVIGSAIATSAFLARITLPRHAQTELPLEVTSVLGIVLAAGSAAAYFSVMLQGNILEMSGTWSTIFRYQTRLLLFYFALAFMIPLIGRCFKLVLRRSIGNSVVLLV